MNRLLQCFTLLAILGFFVISFTYEQLAYQNIFGRVDTLAQRGTAVIKLSVVLALSFNLAKFLVAWCIQKMHLESRYFLPRLYLALAVLVINSGLCSLMLVSEQLDSPNVSEAQYQQRTELTNRHKLEKEQLERRRDSQLDVIKGQYKEKRELVLGLHNPRLLRS